QAAHRLQDSWRQVDVAPVQLVQHNRCRPRGRHRCTLRVVACGASWPAVTEGVTAALCDWHVVVNISPLVTAVVAPVTPPLSKLIDRPSFDDRLNPCSLACSLISSA